MHTSTKEGLRSQSTGQGFIQGSFVLRVRGIKWASRLGSTQETKEGTRVLLELVRRGGGGGGSRSVLEFFVLEQVFRYCIENDITTTANNTTTIYNAVVELEILQDCTISAMSLNKLSSFLREHEYNFF